MRRWSCLLVFALAFLSLNGAAQADEGYCDENGNPVVIEWPPGGPEEWTASCMGEVLIFDHPGFEFEAATGNFQFPKPDDWAGWAGIRVNGWVVINPYGDVLPYVSATTGRTLVPIRFVSEAIGADVKWNEESETATISWRERTIELTIGKQQARINGEPVTLDQPAVLFANRTFVPLRFVGEAFGAEVHWNDSAWVARLVVEGAECNPEYCK